MWLKKIFQKPTLSEKPVIPTITPALIAEAKRHPNQHVYAMDGVSDPNGAVPPERIRGAWKINEQGEIEGDFIPNPNYRPLDRAT